MKIDKFRVNSISVNALLGLIEAKDEAQKKLKVEVSAAIDEVQFFAENQ